MDDNFMKKYFLDNYNDEQLKIIKKMKSSIQNSINEYVKESEVINDNEIKKKNKIKNKEIDDLINQFEEMYYLSSFMTREQIRNLVIRHNGNEEDIRIEIENMF